MAKSVPTSRLTRRNQTTIPTPVRQALGLKGSDTIEYVVEGDTVLLRKREPQEHVDPALGAFLDFLEKDMQAHPERLMPVTNAFMRKLHDLVGDIQVDLDEKV